MLKICKHLSLGLTLITVASAVLLFSDLDHRVGSVSQRRMPRIALMQFNATMLLDDTVRGMREGLRNAGFAEGRNVEIEHFNATGDYATANAMAQDIVSGNYDLILTASTPALQIMAKVNRNKKIPHVFGAVTDPYGAGVGITGPESGQHPPYLTGVGTFQPVAAAFETAHKLRPDLIKVGTVWNPGEQNSEACVLKARAVCRKLGMELIEANAGHASEVADAVRSVLARGAQAVWVGGDTVATSAFTGIMAAARVANVPVFSNDPNDASRGALFGLGASYDAVGEACGSMAADILRGKAPAQYRIEDLAPEVLSLNEALLDRLSQWRVPEEVRRKAEASLVSRRDAGPEAGRTYRVGILSFAPDPIFEKATRGIVEGFAEAGFVAGKNLELKKMHPNGDMSLLPQVTRDLADSGCDLIIPLSTPCLASVCALVKDIPVVFGVVSAPIEAGAGENFKNHRQNVTGAVWTAPYREAFVWLKKIYPDCRRVGVIYNASEANSRRELETTRKMLAALGMTAETRTIGNSSEISQAFQSLVSAGVDAVFGMGDNTVVSSFSALTVACRKHRIPLIADDRSLMGTGALLSVGASPVAEGRHVAKMAARVLLGATPADMPFESSRESETAVDLAAARHLGVSLPAGLLQKADLFLHLHERHERPLRIAMLTIADNTGLQAADRGVIKGLVAAGLQEGRDFTVERLNAQGDLAQVPQLLDAARSRDPDLIVTISTPVLMAVARKITDIPIVFTVASDPKLLGLFEKGRPGNITGVHDDPPLGALLDMACRHNPRLEKVGILYDPAQSNALISVNKLRKACKQRGVGLVEAVASNVSDLPSGVQAIVQQHADAILLSADNLVFTGFPAIIRGARAASVPVFATEPALVKQGATGAIGDDYDAWGVQSGRLAAKVLAGVPPAVLPIEKTRVQCTLTPRLGMSAGVMGPETARPHEVRIVAFNDAHFAEAGRDGILAGLKEHGLEEGRNFNVRIFNAQGDIATLSSIMTSIRAEKVDLLMAISTPVLQAALRQCGETPIVFTCVGDGVRAGAGKSVTDHLPNVTGITTRSPFKGMARLLSRTMPGIRRVGTLFTPSEINSVLYKDWLAEALKPEGIELVAIPVMSTAETAEGAAALMREDIHAVCQIADNATRPGFGQIVRQADARGLPVFCFDSGGAREGASVVLARDFYSAGRESADLAVQVLSGADPGNIPFANTRTEKFIINPQAARRFGLIVPDELLRKAENIVL
ncbi:MAG: hypothetical protein PWP34_1512 [Desulfuromonadales bacterium]|jgi:ABC-type uncharacterized transport system substrate-binding protein|nr:hypothetical protein [Desulfuromonadales bacterium]